MLAKEIISFIIPYFDTNNIKYKILSKDEMDGLIRKRRIYNILQRLLYNDL